MVSRADRTNEFVEQLAVQLEAEGLPRVAGRLFGLLLVSEDARSLDELAQHLGVSKASISVNARLLEEKGIVERISRQADRRDYYQIAEDLLERMLEQRIAKVRRFQQCIANASQTCAIEHSAVRSRLENINRAHDTLVDATSRALDAVRARRSKDRRTPSPSARSR